MSNSKTYKGKFIPVNKEKYKGKINDITYRSSWEKYMMNYLDKNPHVVEWNSEDVVIPYTSKADGDKKRRYFMDFYVKFDNGNIFLFEVKPYKETCEPEKPKRMTAKAKKRFVEELYTYSVNMDKWVAAMKLAKKKGWHFKIVTEHTLRSHFGWKG